MRSDRPQSGARWKDLRAFPGARGIGADKPSERSPTGCAAVARSRAERYARKRRVPRPLWPLVAAVILIALIFERRPRPTIPWGGWHHIGGDDTRAPAAHEAEDAGQPDDVSARPGDVGGAVDGDPKPGYRPPPSFLARDVTQIVAFLIRNRGKLDNDAVRMKWDILDAASLPLAVYLREIEAGGTWGDLEKETLAVPPDLCTLPSEGTPRSLRHRKLLFLLPEWIARGEALLSGAGTDGSGDEPRPDDPDPNGPDGPDGDDDKPPVP